MTKPSEAVQPARADAAEADDAFAVASLDRLIPLEGGLNFRDLGGYRTGSGRRVKRGRLFRSGSLSGLTPAASDKVLALGVRTICDLRTTPERTSEPNRWAEAAQLGYWSRDYEASFGELRRIMGQDLPTAELAKAGMVAGYGQLPYEQAPAYRELFHRIGARELPLIFHCSAGKDRAGTAAALILSALGVPRETVVADYLLSDQLARDRILARNRQHGEGSPTSRLAPEVLRVVLGADASYLAAAFASIEARSGSLEGYLADELGVGQSMLDEIRALLLE
jgi:protein-tyrosine phosphatase